MEELVFIEGDLQFLVGEGARGGAAATRAGNKESFLYPNNSNKTLPHAKSQTPQRIVVCLKILKTSNLFKPLFLANFAALRDTSFKQFLARSQPAMLK